MTDYTDLTPTNYVAGSSVGFETFRALIRNPIAIAEGADDAPRISRKAIAPGGAEIEGAFTNATSAPSSAGFYEYSSLVLTTAKTFPFISIIRIAGDSSLGDTITVTQPTDANILQAAWFNAIIGNNGGDGTGAGGGANVGAGGDGDPNGTGGAGRSMSGIKRAWLNRIPVLGGKGGVSTASGSPTPGKGGGSILIIVHGDLDLTGGTIDADGADGVEDGSSGAGGGAGGSITVICTGTLTGGTFNARGGDGDGDSGRRGGGGGGGRVSLIASAFAGTQTINVTGGSGPGGGDDGAAGFSETETLTEAQINGLLLR